MRRKKVWQRETNEHHLSEHFYGGTGTKVLEDALYCNLFVILLLVIFKSCIIAFCICIFTRIGTVVFLKPFHG